MSLLLLTYYSFIGALAGLFAGLLGVGGGLIAVPGLFLAFELFNISANFPMQTALGTSLGAMVLTSASSAFAHYRLKGINWQIVIRLGPYVALGTLLGASFADRLASNHLKLIFGLLALAIGLYYLLKKHPEKIGSHIKFLPLWLSSIFGIFIGLVSSILGIGGGIVTIPFLTCLGVPIRNAISTSAAIGFAIAVVGALSFIYFGSAHHTQSGSLGYIYVPAFLSLGLTASLLAPFGARLAHTLSASTLRHIFGCYLLIIGFLMIFL